jgi:hypothetical protein
VGVAVGVGVGVPVGVAVGVVPDVQVTELPSGDRTQVICDPVLDAGVVGLGVGTEDPVPPVTVGRGAGVGSAAVDETLVSVLTAVAAGAALAWAAMRAAICSLIALTRSCAAAVLGATPWRARAGCSTCVPLVAGGPATDVAPLCPSAGPTVPGGRVAAGTVAGWVGTLDSARAGEAPPVRVEAMANAVRPTSKRARRRAAPGA